MENKLPSDIESKLINILNYLYTSKLKCIDDEDIFYFPEKFSFKQEEFKEVFKYLDEYSDTHSECNSDVFEEYLMYFKYNKKRFIWRLLIGQGSSLQIIKPNKYYKFKSSKQITLE